MEENKGVETMSNSNLKTDECYLDFKDLNKFFLSDSFIKIISSARFNHKSFPLMSGFVSSVLYIAVSYVEIFGHTKNASLKDLSNTIKDIVLNSNGKRSTLTETNLSMIVKKMVRSKIFKELNISQKTKNDNELFTARKNIIELISLSNKYIAFNSAILNSVKKNNTGLKKLFIKDDIVLLLKIFKSHGLQNYISKESLNESNFNYSLSAEESFFDALKSPRWFSEFCGDGWAVRDFKLAKQKVITDCLRYRLNKQERLNVLQILKKYWLLYKKDTLVFAVLPNENLINKKFEEELFKEKPNTIISYLINKKSQKDINYQISLKDILKTKTIFIKLPRIDSLIKKVTSFDKISN